jgi:hypothetical protein
MGVRTLLTTNQRLLYEHLKQEIREYIQKGIEAFERVAWTKDLLRRLERARRALKMSPDSQSSDWTQCSRLFLSL